MWLAHPSPPPPPPPPPPRRAAATTSEYNVASIFLSSPLPLPCCPPCCTAAAAAYTDVTLPPPSPCFCHCCRAAAVLPNKLPLPPKLRFCQASASAAKLVAIAAVLPLTRCHCLRHCCAAAAANAALSPSCRRRCQAGHCPHAAAVLPCCLRPRHCCCCRCLHCQHGRARWQHGGGGSCRGYACQCRAANALPAAAAAAAAGPAVAELAGSRGSTEATFSITSHKKMKLQSSMSLAVFTPGNIFHSKSLSPPPPSQWCSTLPPPLAHKIPCSAWESMKRPTKGHAAFPKECRYSGQLLSFALPTALHPVNPHYTMIFFRFLWRNCHCTSSVV